MRYVVLVYFIFLINFLAHAQSVLSIDGEWAVRLDSLDKGEEDKWFNDSSGAHIHLPGTLDDAGLGKKSSLVAKLQRPIVDQLTRKHSYIGAAWYSREVLIPEGWKQEQIILFLERVIWKTDVWVDDKKVAGSNESLVAPHMFNLTSLLTPGKHRITVRVDNRKQYNVSLDEKNFAHAYTDGTQIIWNGILGKIELRKMAGLYTQSTQIYTMEDSGAIRIDMEIANRYSIKGKALVSVSIPELLENKITRVEVSGKNQHISFSLPIDKNKIFLWDEFYPKTYNAIVTISAKHKGKTIESQTSTSFGFRKISAKNSQLQINDRRLFLRGTLECAIFPLTGYPPLNESSWEKLFTTVKSYGLNHIRFHSWCPPEEAFSAADKVGIYLQVELPLWSLKTGLNEKDNQFLKAEAERIIQFYGNHPSFMFWSIGNELEGNFDWINSLVADLKARDNRRLYTATTFSFQNGHGKWPEKNDDYFITQYTRKGWVRGQGVFDSVVPNFNKDYSDAVDSIPVPIIAHEIGQYSIYPNMAELNHYRLKVDRL